MHIAVEISYINLFNIKNTQLINHVNIFIYFSYSNKKKFTNNLLTNCKI